MLILRKVFSPAEAGAGRGSALWMMGAKLGALCSGLLAITAPGMARGEVAVDSRGELGAESRAFWPDENGTTYPGNFALTSRLQIDAEVDAEPLDEVAARIRFFTRLDYRDANRRYMVPEELFLKAELEPVQLRVGYQMLNWTATEAFHPADIVNSRILDGSFENPEKIGELMASAEVAFLNGNIELFVLPRFTAPILPSANSAVSLAPPGIQLGPPLILSASRELTDDYWQPQWGAKVAQTVGDGDLSLHVVRHIDRQQPLVLFDPNTLQARPVFQGVTQVGGTYSHVLDQTLLKLEGAYRRFAHPKQTPLGPVPERDHVLIAGGVEQILGWENGSETSVLVEGVALIPTSKEFPDLAEPLFQHDVLVGARHAFNDEQSTSLLATLVVDVVTPEQLISNVSLSRRLGDVWNLTAGARFFNYPPKDASAPILFENMHKQHQAYLNLTRYF